MSHFGTEILKIVRSAFASENLTRKTASAFL